MSDKNNSIATLLKDTIGELVDYDASDINSNTNMEELHLVSLDYVTIMVTFKKELGIAVDLDAMAEAELQTFDDLVNFVASSPLEEETPA
ncbi:acyl carrier protein [Pseudoalteromonas sp. CO348]|uniref:acyl carrier protein n=1 Tax=Pseudoalteromonas TaxID=53246 RepID=UPI00102350F8|nr:MULTISPECIES: acyl carrier protein [Pseudoalteromonas]MCG7539014.1 acyl carrier protein [Pseudoalteromonas sp. OF7H-1]QZO13368.1 acyl carrier protein [Pseudoalteromonas piscicida]RZG03252.1 acyl carrier protein [Pseudoalteromonas sp. CO348]